MLLNYPSLYVALFDYQALTVSQLYLSSFYAHNPYTNILHTRYDWQHDNQKQTDTTTEIGNLLTQALASRSLTSSPLQTGKFSFPQREDCSFFSLSGSQRQQLYPSFSSCNINFSNTSQMDQLVKKFLW